MNISTTAHMISATTAGENSTEAAKDAKLKKACQDFEGYFINEVFKSMRKTVPDNDFIKKGKGEKMYREMMDQEIATGISKEDGLGLSESLYSQLKKEFKGSF